jgi:uncharacterized protein
MAKKNDVNYFDVLITAADYSHRTAVALNDLMANYEDVHNKAEAIHGLEHAADLECHRLMDALNVAFITPIDREDIHDMINSIDDITDLLEDVSNRFDMLSIMRVRPEAIKMGQFLETATGQLHALLIAFKNYKKNKDRIHDLVMSVNTLEEEGDRLYREFIKQLFVHEKDVLEIIKWKEVFDDMENVLDACEDVADIVEAVCMKQN